MVCFFKIFQLLSIMIFTILTVCHSITVLISFTCHSDTDLPDPLQICGGVFLAPNKPSCHKFSRRGSLRNLARSHAKLATGNFCPRVRPWKNLFHCHSDRTFIIIPGRISTIQGRISFTTIRVQKTLFF